MKPGAGRVRAGVRLWFASTAVALGGVAPGPWLPGWAARARDTLRDDGRNAADRDRMERGYYERLLEPSRGPAAPASAHAPAEDFGPLTVPVADAREYVLRPDLGTTLRGAPWTTNADGQRDRPFLRPRPAGMTRIALVGDSIGSGWGVADGAGFEPTWERELDARSRAGGGAGVEVCNLAVPGHAPGQRWEHFRRVGWALGPDWVVFQGSAADLAWDERKLRSLLPRGLGWDAPGYRPALDAAGVRPGGSEESYRAALRPRREAILAGVYRAAVADCRSHGVGCAWLLLPRVGKPAGPAERAALVRIARAAGFDPVLDLSDALDGIPPAGLAIGPDDFHPNARGHRLIADRLGAAWSPTAPPSPPSSTTPVPGAHP